MEAITASEGNSHQAVRNGWRGQDLTEDAQAGKMSQTGGRQPGAPHLEKTADTQGLGAARGLTSPRITFQRIWPHPSATVHPGA